MLVTLGFQFEYRFKLHSEQAVVNRRGRRRNKTRVVAKSKWGVSVARA